MAEKIVPVKTLMSEQPVEKRVKNFDEVALGYSEEDALREAVRCLQCKKMPCVAGCPVQVDIPTFIGLIAEKDFLGAGRKLKEKNVLPAICGRVCPQEDQCEKECTLGKKHQPVAIGRLERFAADYERNTGRTGSADRVAPPPSRSKKKVAVVGAGPAGLTVSGDLARLYQVTLFEALHKPGGVLVYGIPEFRLPKAIVEAEVEYIQSLGAELKVDMIIGKTFTIDELFDQGFQAVFIGIGAGLPVFMRIPGENLNGVYSANEFLTRSNLMKAYLFPEYDTPIKKGKRVAVVGGGNVALDSARTALRLGADEVHLVYRRTEQEMPARLEEFHHAKEEGIIFDWLTLPKRIMGEESVCGMECAHMELGEPDESGRRSPVEIPGSEFTLDVDLVIMAIGTRANPLLTSATPGLELNQWGYITVNPLTGQTNKKGVFAGGDIVTGSATVISAMGAGRIAAQGIDCFLSA